MPYNIVVTERAERHIKDSIKWNEIRKKGLGKFLMLSIKDCFRLIKQSIFLRNNSFTITTDFNKKIQLCFVLLH